MPIFNKDLDFIEFSTNIIRQVDSISSSGKSGSEQSQEPRINAFYRAIGLPAIITNPYIKLVAENNGNIFNINDVEILSGLNRRLTVFNKNNNLKEAVTNKMLSNLFDFNKSSIKDSISGDVLSKRAQLFPMYVDANIEIFPQSKRIGGAFMTDERLRDISSNDKTSYSRPLIETVISLRLSDLGAINSVQLNKVQTDIFQDFKKISINIQISLLKSLGNITVEMSSIKKKIDSIRKKTSDQIIPTKTPSQNQSIQSNPNGHLSELDKEAKNQNDAISLKAAELSLFNYDDTVYLGQANTRNLKDAILASSLIDVVFSDGGQIEKAKNNTTEQKNQVIVSMKQTFRDMDSILGTFSGLSGTDAIAVLYSLFTIDIVSLVSLINKDARIRMKNMLNVDCVETVNGVNIKDVKEAVITLQNKVQATIESIADSIKKNSK